MIKFKDLYFNLLENTNSKYVYRGVTSHGNQNLGTQSRSVQDKLVATLGPNYTDVQEIAMIFKKGAGTGGKLIKKKLSGKVLELSNYNDVMHLYAKYKDQMTSGIVDDIKQSSGSEQLKHIQSAGNQLRNILKDKGYMWIKVPFAVSDASNFKRILGMEGNILIDLSFS